MYDTDYHDWDVIQLLQDTTNGRDWNSDSDYLCVAADKTIRLLTPYRAGKVCAQNDELFFKPHLVKWSASSMRCPTYGNCPTCYSSEPLAEICTQCLEKEIIGPDSTMKLHRYSSFSVGSISVLTQSNSVQAVQRLPNFLFLVIVGNVGFIPLLRSIADLVNQEGDSQRRSGVAG